MEKVGMMRIKVNRINRKPRKCMSCSGEGEYRVIYKDYWGKLTVTLCGKCANKQYEDLGLQSRLKLPVVA